MRRGPTLLAALPFLLLAPAAAAAPFTEQVPMRDGTRLATDVWLPEGPGPWPVLLRRTPYGRALEGSAGDGFNSLGFAVVSQDVRGRGGSEGRFLPFFDDATDGPDTMAWIDAQPWGGGPIGTWGGSAEGVVQWMALPDAPDSLKCAMPMVATDDVHRGMMPGGAWRQELATAWLEALKEPEALAQWRAHEAGDAWWDPARLDPVERSRIRASVLAVGGVYDIFAADTLRSWQDLGNPASRPSWMVLGPWTHGAVSPPDSGLLWEGQVGYPRAAGYRDFFVDFIDFFDWCLRDGPRPVWAPLRYAVSTLDDEGNRAEAEWRTADRWEPGGPVQGGLFLHPDGSLQALLPPAGASPREIPVDPASPVASTGGNNLTTPAGPFDQAGLSALPGVAAFRTAPLSRDVVLLGEPVAFLRASSSTDDGDVVVRLSQVTPSGRVMLLADGVLRGRFREGTVAAAPLVPGQAVEWVVPLGPVAHRVRAGHALEIAVQGTSAPRYEPNPGTFGPLASDREPVASTLSLRLGRDDGPCRVALPLASGKAPWEDDCCPDPDVILEEAGAEAVPEVADVPPAGDARDDGAGDGVGDGVGDLADAAPADLPAPDPGTEEGGTCPASGGCAAAGGPGGAAGTAAVAAWAWAWAWGTLRRGRGPRPTRRRAA